MLEWCFLFVLLSFFFGIGVGMGWACEHLGFAWVAAMVNE
jgi:hypothetical protein